MGDDAVDGPTTGALESNPQHLSTNGTLDNAPEGYARVLVSRPADGLVREVKTNKMVSREETDELLETEAVRHLGDFSDEVSTRVCGILRSI